jgi:hypothetical protein
VSKPLELEITNMAHETTRLDITADLPAHPGESTSAPTLPGTPCACTDLSDVPDLYRLS